MGADDYITKPFSVREFRSRVKAALRRAGWPQRERPEKEADRGRRPRDRLRRAVIVRGAEVDADLRRVRDPHGPGAPRGGSTAARRCSSSVWGDSDYRDPRTVDVHIRHLREKLELDAKEPEFLFTVRGVGYRFREF